MEDLLISILVGVFFIVFVGNWWCQRLQGDGQE